MMSRHGENVLGGLLSKLASRPDVTPPEIAAIRYEIAFLRRHLGCGDDQVCDAPDSGRQADDLSLIILNRTLTEKERSAIETLIASHFVSLELARAAGETPRLPRRVMLVSDDQGKRKALRITDHDLTDDEISEVWERNRESELVICGHEMPVAPTIH